VPLSAQLAPRLRWIGERGLRVETGPQTLARYRHLLARALPGVIDIIPADGSLLVILAAGAAPSAELLAALTEDLVEARAARAAIHEIPVHYGGGAGPDLAALAQASGLSVADVVGLHAAADYTVAFVGFQPGFAYLAGAPQALRLPRKASPALRVAAGSVAIGGPYSGIYPFAGPAGWHVIGRTPLVLLDPQRQRPALLAPGDRVRFVPQ
jgi:KipI family sensor histidine kinase inhibitor